MSALNSQGNHKNHPRRIVISGGTDGMGRALALERAHRGDTVIAIGHNQEKGDRLLTLASQAGVAEQVEFLPADLSTIAGTLQAVDDIAARHDVIDGLALFANRQAPQRLVTSEGLEHTFALYYLSRYLLSHGLQPLLARSQRPVIVNVAGVGVTKGQIHWDDLQLKNKYGTVRAQLQAGRANDLLGVAFAEDNPGTSYVLYHPGFTRSGDLSPLPALARVTIRALAKLAARPVEKSIAPIHQFIDAPPQVPLTAIDRGKSVPLTLSTLDSSRARRLAEATDQLLSRARKGLK